MNTKLKRMKYGLLFVVFLLTTISFAKNKDKDTKQDNLEVSGVVTSVDGIPLAGVNIKLKGSKTGTTTDFDGHFQIMIPGDEGILIIEYVGYKTHEVDVNEDNSDLTIVLEEDLSQLSEVVVIGYGTQKKSDLTGAVSSISSDAINMGGITNFDQAIQGRAAGVQVTQASGAPGSSTNIRIRGTSSVNASSEPLYVIDGMLVNSNENETSIGGRGATISPLATINPSDIESIEILKDASATAIYGSRGANGVILITTKKGKEGKGTINFNASYGVQEVSRRLNLLNAEEYALLVNEAEVNAGRKPVYINPSSLGEGTDWQKELFRIAAVSDYQISFSGGDDKTKYSLSGGFFTQDGIVIATDFKRYNFRSNFEREMNDKLKVGAHLSYARVSSNGVLTGAGGDGQINQGIISNGLQFNPILTVYNPNEPGGYTYEHDRKDNVGNPVAEAREYDSKSVTSKLLGNLFAEYRIVPGLKFKSSLGLESSTSKSNEFGPNFLRQSETSKGEAGVYMLTSLTWLNENTLNFNKQINETDYIDAVAGFTIQQFKNESLSALAFGFPDSRTGYHDLSNADNPQNPVNDELEWSLLSYLGRVNYSLKDRYMFTLSGRIDGSSKFSQGNKYGYFPSGAFAWKVMNEPFMADVDFFQNLKLRASYGLTGNQSIPPYQSLSLIKPFGEGVFNSGSGKPVVFRGQEPVSYPNTGLKWETTRQINLGLDMSILDGRVNLTADFYNKKTSDLLLESPIPFTSGFERTLLNIGNVTNKGFDIDLTGYIFNGEFNWKASGNISINRNKITNLVDGEDVDLLVGGSILREGMPIGTFRGYVADGVFQSDEEAAEAASLRGQSAKAGDIRYKDVSGPDGTPDGVIDEYDREILGTAEPDFTWGFNNEFSYKNFNLTLFFQGAQGNKMVNLNNVELENLNGEQNVLAKAGQNRWTPNNPSQEYPRAVRGNSFNTTFSSRFVEDASYIRLKNITLGYNFPKGLVERIGVSNLNLYGSITNAFTITNYSGYDPEGNAYGGTTNLVGIDDGIYPQSRTFTIGLNVSF